MKTLVIFFSVIGLMTLNSCKQETDVQTLLENAETRSEIIKTIAGNHTFMKEFMEGMYNNDHAMNMMKGNKKMMDMMMAGKGMQMMMKDSVMMNNMMSSMMKDGTTMGNLMKTMYEKGMMSKDCMVSCMNMMKDKRMHMSQMESDKIENHDSRNH